MKEIWNKMGYAHLNLTSGNLRDQSSKQGKVAHKEADISTIEINNDNQVTRSSDNIFFLPKNQPKSKTKITKISMMKMPVFL